MQGANLRKISKPTWRWFLGTAEASLLYCIWGFGRLIKKTQKK